MIGINDGVVQYFLICLFLFYLNPNCRVLCGEANQLKRITMYTLCKELKCTSFSQVPSMPLVLVRPPIEMENVYSLVSSKFCDMPTLLPNTNITYQCSKYIKNESKSCIYNETVFESTAINISCDSGYSTDVTVSFCRGNEWVPPITGCSKTCKKLNPVNVHLECFHKNISIPCDEKFLVSGVTVSLTCDHLNSSGFQFYPGHHEIHCQEDGTWDNDLLSCVQDCGRLQKNLSDSETRGMPWDVAIFRVARKVYGCFGTIISPRVILTSELCVLSSSHDRDYKSLSRNPLDPEVFKVGIMSDLDLHHQNNSTWWSRLKNVFKKDNHFTPLKIKEFRYFKNGNQDKSLFHDVLIVIMDKEINFNSHVSPACVQWENSNRLNITTGIAKVQQYNPRKEGLRYKDYSFLRHDACQKNPTYPYLVYNWACLLYNFDMANGDSNDTKLFRKSNQTAFHEGKLFCLELKQDELNDFLTVGGSGVMIEKDHRYFIRGIAGIGLFRNRSNNDIRFKKFMNNIHSIANISYENFSKNISGAMINGTSDTIFFFKYNFSSLLQNHLKLVDTELPNEPEKLVSVTDVADYLDWIKHVVVEVDPYYI